MRKKISSDFIEGIGRIYASARATDDGQRCLVAPHPELAEKIKKELSTLRAQGPEAIRAVLRAGEVEMLGFNDAAIHPPDYFPLGTPPNVMRAGAAERAPLQ